MFRLAKRLTERWPSGRRRSPAKGVWVNSPSRVRIPPSPPELLKGPLVPLRVWVDPGPRLWFELQY